MSIRWIEIGVAVLLAVAWSGAGRGETPRVVDASTLSGKVMAGHQGWFNCEGDGADRGWVHWTKRRGPLGPGTAKVDLWPDVSELGPDERFPTGFTNAKGEGDVAEVFSSYKAATVWRHFEWMREYGIDDMTYEGLPSDFYLRLTGAGGRLLRGEIPITDSVPISR